PSNKRAKERTPAVAFSQLLDHTAVLPASIRQTHTTDPPRSVVFLWFWGTVLVCARWTSHGYDDLNLLQSFQPKTSGAGSGG
ncbi:ustiloxin B cluster transcription factor ustR, partial [Dissostichus eleginoides]